MHLAVAGVEELSRDSSTYGKRMSLAERSGGVLYTALNVALGVTGSDTTPLAEVLQVFQSELTCQAELCVQHWCHVSRVEEEAVASLP